MHGSDPAAQRERIPTKVFQHAHEVSSAVATQIAELINRRASERKPCVLGLATGSSPVTVYNELVRMVQRKELSFKHVITFNLDEYYPMAPGELQSYRRFMFEHLFDHVDIDPANVHIPDGQTPIEQVAAFCEGYERAIAQAGGIDLQLLGIGRTGHIGFNEPGSARTSRTRLITLDRVTRLDAASDFFGEANVPRRAITMGVGSILDARRVILMAFGENKAQVVAAAIEGPVTPQVAASFLQEHANAAVYLDRAAAAELTRYKCPWLVRAVDWDETAIRRAVLWLSRAVSKPILKLTAEDYNEHGLQELLAQRGSAYDINLAVFRGMQRTITGWPGGKPREAKQTGDIDRPTDEIFPKRVIVFSPHPDDDVISMGGTLIRLVDQGHEVHVAYQTSGNIAVFDDDALRFADFAVEFNRLFKVDQERSAQIERHIEEFLRHKRAAQVDSTEVQEIKSIIRRGEARAAGRFCGVSLENLHFLNMPFYETGRVRKKSLSDVDIELIVALLERVRPHQVYAAGDLSDPHGTHRTCLAAVFQAVSRLAAKPGSQPFEVWLYRGAWQEWDPEQIEMAVPLSPNELERKIGAIFKHQSQKDRALFPGTDEREFWQRAQARNRETARLYNSFGLPEYEAIEAFVKWDGGAADSY